MGTTYSFVFYYLIPQVVTFLFMLFLLGSREYSKKKGANLADKEDMAAITNKIEEVKNQFTKENEFLKANLQFVINNQLQTSNEGRNAIISFYDSYSKWINVGLVDLKLSDYDRNNIDAIIQKRRQLDNFYIEANLTQSRVGLLIDNGELVVLSHALMISTLEFSQWSQMLLLKLEHNLEDS